MIDKIFIEYGLDFDNNKFGLGRSIEAEYSDGSEERFKTLTHSICNKSYYFRFWIFKTVFIYSKNGFEINNKNRNNLKIVFGISAKHAGA